MPAMMKCPIEGCGGLAEGEGYCPKCGQTLLPIVAPAAPPPRLFPESEVLGLRAEIQRMIGEAVYSQSDLVRERRKVAQLESREAEWRECAKALAAARVRIDQLQLENAELKKERRVCQICHSREVGALTHVPIYPDPGYSRER